jgi:hypothetical protein
MRSGYAKAHKVLHMKVRNRLNNKTVHQLYCYVNLRLIRRYKTRAEGPDSQHSWSDGRWAETSFEASKTGGEQVEDEQELEGRE